MLLAGGSVARSAPVFDPAYHFRSLSTEHFRVYFHQGEDRLATRLAAIAEDVWQQLRLPLGRTPPPLTHVVLVDQTELANGFATPLPYDTVVVTAVWPAGWEFIGKTDDWLRLVFTHEFTHIVHLDRSEGWARFVRGVFGRMPLTFPNLFLPAWQIEGIATYEESAITGTGREHAGDFRAIVDEAARSGRLEPLDRVNRGLTDWPGADVVYAYGLGFHAYLAERFGAHRLAALADATARTVPFTSSRAFKRVYGQSLGELWRDYEAGLKSPAAPASDVTARRLTYHGFRVLGPRFAPAACATCRADILYSVDTPHDFPALYRLALDGSAPVRLTSRYLGSGVAAGGGVVYFDQLELHRETGLYSDLYALDRISGRVTRLTSEARLLDPDLSPDGKTLVCVQESPGRRDLVLLSDVALASGGSTSAQITTILSGQDTQFNAPRWSPDGRTIAVERHIPGHQTEIVIVDVATRAVRTIASDAKARFVTPTWRRDGQAIVAAADLDEGPFNLYEIAVALPAAFASDEFPRLAPRRLTSATGGAIWPDVAPDGQTIVFVGYTVDGFDLFEMPYPAPAPYVAQAGRPTDAELQPRVTNEDSPPAAEFPDLQRSAASPRLQADDYNPVPTLRPTSWSPLVAGDRHQLRLGLATGGVDVLGYHAYALAATWLVSSPLGALTPGAATPDWQVYYQYARWRPTAWLAASSSTSFFAGPAGQAGVPTTATLRERQVEGGILLPIRHVRVSHTLLSSLVRAVDDFTLPGGLVSRNWTAWRAAWAVNSSHTYGYSISPENGVSMGVTAEIARRAFGSSGDASAVTADGRVYVSPFVRHQVLAVRFGGGISRGDPAVRRTFGLGGVDPNLSLIDFGRNAISLLRGFGSDTFAGSHVALMNAEYRWPVASPQRGHGTWPLFLHTVHAAVFADAGHAWTSRFDARDLKTSIGGELSLDVIGGYSFPFTAVLGAAWGRDGSRAVENGGSAYVRIGRAF